MCTMAEREYALEMWRLLDPDSKLINSVQLLDRLVCVKSGMFNPSSENTSIRSIMSLLKSKLVDIISCDHSNLLTLMVHLLI